MIGETTKSADGIQGMTDKEIIKVLDNNGNGYYTYYSELEGWETDYLNTIKKSRTDKEILDVLYDVAIAANRNRLYI